MTKRTKAIKHLSNCFSGSFGGRDAIILSGWTWSTFGSPERIALALAETGCQVLYCENPVSQLKSRRTLPKKIYTGIHRAVPAIVSHRLNRARFLAALQAKLLASQILEDARSLNLRNPFAMTVAGQGFLPLAHELKKSGMSVVHICMDFPTADEEHYIKISDITLVIPKSIFHPYKARYGKKIFLIPQVTAMPETMWVDLRGPMKCKDLAVIPRPRIGYIGPVTDRLNLKVIHEVLAAHPEWNFVHFGEAKCLPLSNVHVLPWRSPEQLQSVTAGLDLGFMPYDCHSNKNFHCMPLKVFDYFSLGLPVVSTPIVNLWQYEDVIYFGDDAEEISRAIELALSEPASSSKRARRIAIAREHTIHDLAKSLAQIFGLPRPVDSPLIREASV